jgi:hypothetical protein
MRSIDDDARILIASVERALARGTKHFDIDGNALNTVEEILEALCIDGRIRFEPKPPQ